MYMTYMSDNITETYEFEKLDTGKQILVIFVVCISIFQDVLFSCVEICNFLAALSIYEITSKWQVVFSSEGDTKSSAKLLIRYLDEIRKQLKIINETNNQVLLIVYIQTLSWISSSALDLLEDINWLRKCFMVVYYVLYILTYYFAAEANHKVSIHVVVKAVKLFHFEYVISQ